MTSTFHNLDSNWHHRVITLNNSGLIRDFIDGQLINSTTISNFQWCNSTSAILKFGAWWNFDMQSWDGKIDDIGIWNRVLTQQEITAIFNGCQDSIIVQPQNFTAFNSVGWANFTCKSSDTAATYQWQQNNGTGWTNLTNFGIFSGTNSDSLVINGITGAMNNYGYRCLVTGCESDTSETATLFVSNGVGLNEAILYALTLSPNPTSGIVRFNQPIEGTYRVITSEGRVVQKGEMGEAIDLSAYPDGIYQIEVQSSNERRTFKAVKHR
jgi:hypothetical protein